MFSSTNKYISIHIQEALIITTGEKKSQLELE